MVVEAFRPWVRQRTGSVLVFLAYVVDSRNGQVVKSCGHRHTRRSGHTGAYFAERCAARMARQMNRDSKLGEGAE